MPWLLRDRDRSSFDYLVAYAEAIVKTAHPDYRDGCDLKSYLTLITATYSTLREPVPESLFSRGSASAAHRADAASAAHASVAAPMAHAALASPSAPLVSREIHAAATVAVAAAIGVKNSIISMSPTSARTQLRQSCCEGPIALRFPVEHRGAMALAAEAAHAVLGEDNGELDIATANAVATAVLQQKLGSASGVNLGGAVSCDVSLPVADVGPQNVDACLTSDSARVSQVSAAVSASHASSLSQHSPSLPIASLSDASLADPHAASSPTPTPLAASPSPAARFRVASRSQPPGHSGARPLSFSLSHVPVTSLTVTSTADVVSDPAMFSSLPKGRTSFTEIYEQWHKGIDGQPPLFLYSASNALTQRWEKSNSLDVQVSTRKLVVTEMDRIARDEAAALSGRSVAQVMVERYSTFCVAVKRLTAARMPEHKNRMGRPPGSVRGRRGAGVGHRAGRSCLAVGLAAVSLSAEESKLADEVDMALGAAYNAAGGVAGGDAAINAMVAAAEALPLKSGDGGCNAGRGSRPPLSRTSPLPAVVRAVQEHASDAPAAVSASVQARLVRGAGMRHTSALKCVKP